MKKIFFLLLLWPSAAMAISRISDSGSASSGAASSGSLIYPATATPSFPYGASASTMSFTGSGNAFIRGISNGIALCQDGGSSYTCSTMTWTELISANLIGNALQTNEINSTDLTDTLEIGNIESVRFGDTTGKSVYLFSRHPLAPVNFTSNIQLIIPSTWQTSQMLVVQRSTSFPTFGYANLVFTNTISTLNVTGPTTLSTVTVSNVVASSQITGPYVYDFSTQTDSYTIVLADGGKYVTIEKSSANTLTIPTHASVGLSTGTVIRVLQLGAGQTTVVASGGVNLRSQASAYKLAGQYAGAVLIKIASNTWIVEGNLTP
jgi:hypothetical protein